MQVKNAALFACMRNRAAIQPRIGFSPTTKQLAFQYNTTDLTAFKRRELSSIIMVCYIIVIIVVMRSTDHVNQYTMA